MSANSPKPKASSLLTRDLPDRAPPLPVSRPVQASAVVVSRPVLGMLEAETRISLVKAVAGAAVLAAQSLQTAATSRVPSRGTSLMFRAGCYVPVLLLLLPLANVCGIEDIEGQDGRIGTASLAFEGSMVRGCEKERARELRCMGQIQRWPCLPRPARGTAARRGRASKPREKSE